MTVSTILLCFTFIDLVKGKFCTVKVTEDFKLVLSHCIF